MSAAALAKTAYVAGKYGGDFTTNAMYYVKQSGHHFPYNWQADTRPQKPFLAPEFKVFNGLAAEDMLHYAHMAQLFVLVVEDNIYGAMTEFGIALASRKMFPTKRIIVTFAPNADRRESIFFAVSGVEVVEWADLLARLTNKDL